MTQSHPPAAGRTVESLVAAAAEEARCEVSRADGKAGMLLTLATGALAGLVTFAQAGHVAPPAAVLLWLAAAMCAAAVGVLLTVIRPRLGSSRAMFADHEALLTAGAGDLPGWHEARLRMFSVLAVAKHRRIRRAVDLLAAGLGLLAVAAPLVLAGGAR